MLEDHPDFPPPLAQFPLAQRRYVHPINLHTAAARALQEVDGTGKGTFSRTGIANQAKNGPRGNGDINQWFASYCEKRLRSVLIPTSLIAHSV
jgi:hypothetical protein